MSALFGPVVQQGYVVPDIQAAMRHWIARGIGPFFIEEHIRPKGEYDGGSIRPDLSAAFAYSGDQQVGWDGVTAPIRRIDWSTGTPVPEIVDD